MSAHGLHPLQEFDIKHINRSLVGLQLLQLQAFIYLGWNADKQTTRGENALSVCNI